jgi:hypothetical protein
VTDEPTTWAVILTPDGEVFEGEVLATYAAPDRENG